MTDIDIQRKSVNRQQTKVRDALTKSPNHQEAINLFLRHHATLHSTNITDADLWSFEDAILDDMSDAQIRRIPRNEEHSVAWCIWHLARIEDTAMNILIADGPQIFSDQNWGRKLGVPFQDSGNDMTMAEVNQLSENIDLATLREYRRTVGRQTQGIVRQLTPNDLKAKVDPERIQRVMDEGALLAKSKGIADYWSKRNVAGLLLMPASRHIIVHLNEALRLKRRQS